MLLLFESQKKKKYLKYLFEGGKESSGSTSVRSVYLADLRREEFIVFYELEVRSRLTSSASRLNLSFNHIFKKGKVCSNKTQEDDWTSVRSVTFKTDQSGFPLPVEPVGRFLLAAFNMFSSVTTASFILRGLNPQD